MIKDLINKLIGKEEPAHHNYHLEKLERDMEKKVPVILGNGVAEDEPYLSIMDDSHCIAVNHKFYHMRLACPCLEWELENDNEYGQRKQFTIDEAKKLKMTQCRDCWEYLQKMDKLWEDGE